MKQALDFIVIGAQKSGTTTLFEYLRRHPELCLPAAKEVPYFSNDARYSGDWNEYLRKAFAFADSGCKWGTVTPQYMYGATFGGPPRPDGSSLESDALTVPSRIRDRLPDVRLIAVLRDPVQRARSHHAMASLNGWDTRSFDQAVEQLLEPAALLSARRVVWETTGYVVWGEYGRILAGYLEVFERRQLLLLFSSELQRNPRSVLRRVFEFLAVDPEFVPDNLGTNYREGGASRRLHWLDLNRLQRSVASNQLARTVWHSLPEQTRRRVDTRFDRTNYLVRLWNRRGSTRAEEPESKTERVLRWHYTADAALLAERFDVVAPWSTAPTSLTSRPSERDHSASPTG